MNQSESVTTDIAIIGMAGRFPGAPNVEALWQNLRDGVEAITFFSKEELLAAGVDPQILNSPNYVRAAGVLDDISGFDAAFFGMTPREAEITDPQHRLFLESAWAALEDAGYTAAAYPGLIGVYAGSGANTYLYNLYSQKHLLETVGDIQTIIGNTADYLSTRASYKLNLKGPSISVQTACSTSLVAVHLACQSLLNHECDMALAGGVSLAVPHVAGYLYQEGGITSPDGHCRAFDAQAQGSVGGNGVALVVLKRLSDALTDGDCIHAIIKGSAINNDGLDKIGFTAPSIQGQAEAIAEALTIADVDPETISYLEAHGTGTALGDPIEVTALTQVFRARTQRTGFCALGSVKTNLGHLDAAAGVTGLIKVVLALKYRQLPPSLHFIQPNARLNLENSPFYVNTALCAWESSAPLRAGVSAFGLGGTNAHVILQEAPPQHMAIEQDARPWQILLLSAKTETALETTTGNLATYLWQHSDVPLADVAYTLQVGRQEFSQRRFIVCQEREQALYNLDALDQEQVFTASCATVEHSLVFMFPGGGAQYLNMGRQLYEVEATFRFYIDMCTDILQPHLGLDLRNLLYPTEEKSAEATQKLLSPSLGLPALFVVSYSLAQLWLSWGIQPTAMIGHSMGEYVAACLAGVFSLEDALALVVLRGHLFEQLPEGAMLSIPLPPREIEPLLGKQLSLAAINGPSQCVVSGAVDALVELQTLLQMRGVETRKVQISVAAHSTLVNTILPDFTQFLQKIHLQAPTLPYISNVTGTWITAEEAMDLHYWARHLRQTVHFAAGIETLLQEGHFHFLEVGPGQTLSSLVRLYPKKSAGQLILSSMRHPKMLHSDLGYLLVAMGRLWLSGLSINWAGFYKYERRRRLPLPTYPFEHHHYWIERQVASLQAQSRSTSLPRKPDLAEWGYQPSWKQSFSLVAFASGNQPASSDSRCWLIYLDEGNLGTDLIEHLQTRGQRIVTVQAADHFYCRGPLAYTLHPEREEDYERLLVELCAANLLPERIIHLWNVTPHESALHIGEATPTLATSFYSLLFLARALGRQKLIKPLHLAVVSTELHSVTGEERLCPSKATLLALCKVLPQEYSNITCQSIDLVFSEVHNGHTHPLLSKALLHELDQPNPEPVIAYRGRYRWVQAFEQVPLLPVAPEASRLRQGGVYLITGGMGGMGLGLAEALAERVRARLILVGRSTFPAIEQWQTWQETHAPEEEISQKIRQLRRIEELGGEVIVLQADVSNLEQMQTVIAQTLDQFGALHGVIHAAGIISGVGITTIPNLQPEDCERVLLPKTQGLLVLEQVLRGCKLDFCLLQSSISSVLGGLEFAAYAAANLFMDAFIQCYKAAQPTSWMSVNWDGWQAWNDPHNQKNKTQSLLTGATQAGLSMNAQEGLDVIERILSGQMPQVVISTADLQARINQWIKLESLRDALPIPKLSLQARTTLSTNYQSPLNDVEQTLVTIWQTLFGIEQISIHDNFFELGGHSLLAIQALSKMNQALGSNISLTHLFQTPTIEKIAAQFVPNIVVEPSITIPRLAIAAYYPLSYSQRSFFLLHQLAPQSTAYNTSLAFQIVGVLDKARLDLAFHMLIQRHEALRTSFMMVDGALAQSVKDDILFVLSEVFATETELITLLHSLVTPFDLSSAPLLRAFLIQLTEKQHVLFLDMHHIITDGISITILLQDLQRLYAGEVLSQPRIHYTDFATWQNAQLSSASMQEQEQYWSNIFPDIPPVLMLPTDHQRTINTNFAGASIELTLEPSLVIALRQLALQQGLTLHMLLLAIYNVLLALWTGQDDIVVGCPVAGRTHSDVQDVIGVFVNVLALRNRPERSKAFIAFLEEVRVNALQAYEHQDYPFEQLVKQLPYIRDTSRNPLFDTMLDFMILDAQQLSLPGCIVTPYEFAVDTAKFDLAIDIMQADTDLKLILQYKTTLFKQATIERLARHLVYIMQQITVDPTLPIGQIALEPSRVRTETIWAYNHASMEYPRYLTIHELFAQQVLYTPNAIAVKLADEQISYAQLHSISNRLARLLQSKGIKRGDMIPIVAKRSLSMVVGMLAVLKAGGAYIPIDCSYPTERIRYVLQETNASLILANCVVAGMETYLDCFEIIDLDDERILAFDDADLSCQVGPTDIAYVIYTSGTTGQPKGALISHANLVNMCFAWRQEYRLETFEVNLLQVASFAFDLFTADIMRALTGGGRLVLCPEGTRIDLPRLAQLIKQEAITIFEATPALIIPLLNYCQYNDLHFPSLRILTLGSDAFYAHDYHVIRAQLPDSVQIINSYGVTEGTIDSCYYADEGRGASVLYTQTVPIGRPFPNIQLYVLNEHFLPQPIGIPGELYIAGAGVGYGYLHHPEQTAAVFLPNPFSAGERMYRTGDQARLLADNIIELLGRKDNQIQLGGYRIELAEIETQLLAIEHIKEAAVVCKVNAADQKTLCAYVVASSVQTEGTIKSILSTRLPGYMIPSNISLLESLPVTPNGKIDREALLHHSEASPEVVYSTPQNALEGQLMTIWQEILGLERISTTDSFFDLGGNSLLLLALFNRINQEIDAKLSVADLFSHHTIEMLAAMIQSDDQLFEADPTVVQSIDAILAAMQAGHIDLLEAQAALDRLQ